jgi:hypothetical protein
LKGILEITERAKGIENADNAQFVPIPEIISWRKAFKISKNSNCSRGIV